MRDARSDSAAHNETDNFDDPCPMPRMMPLSEVFFVTMFVAALLIIAALLYPA